MRKLTLAALALAVAGGVYLTGGTAQASNMGFKLEREFTPLPTYRNIYFVAFPLFNGLQDIGDAADATDPCAPADGNGDTIVDALDAICDLWTDRNTPGFDNGTFTLTKRDTGLCTYLAASLVKDPDLGTFYVSSFNGDITAGINREISYRVDVFAGPGQPATTNRAVIVGSHDPSHMGHTLSVAGGCFNDFINNPYHSMYRTADEILCGLEGSGWVDMDGDTNPDTCTEGIFDEVSGAQTALLTFRNIGVPSPGTFVARTVLFDVDLGGLIFSGEDYDLIPGEGYRVDLQPGYNSQVFRPPHF